MNGSGIPIVGTKPRDMPMLIKKCRNNIAAKLCP
jgi:hypothetical protein